MNYDEFDYLDKSLTDWTAEFVYKDDPDNWHISHWDYLTLVESEYLPRFEAALHRHGAAAKLTNKHWNNSHTAQLPFNVVVEDEEVELEKVPGLLIVGQQ